MTHTVEQPLVAFGDSNTEGANWESNGYDPALKWVTLLQHDRGKRIINAGVGGNTSSQARVRFQKDVLDKKPSAVFIMIGTNDARMVAPGKPEVDQATFCDNLQFFVDQLVAIDSQPILMTCLPVIEGNGQDGYYYSRHERLLYEDYGGARRWNESYNEVIRELSAEKQVPLIDLRQAIAEDVTGSSEAADDLDRALIASGFYDPSGTHFSPQGAQFVYEVVKRHWELVFQK